MSKLKRMADFMMMAAYKGKDQTVITETLSGGVHLRLIASSFQFSLLVMRLRVPPSEIEMKVFRNVFEVADPTEKTGQAKEWHYYWLVWNIPEKMRTVQAPLEKETASI